MRRLTGPLGAAVALWAAAVALLHLYFGGFGFPDPLSLRALHLLLLLPLAFVLFPARAASPFDRPSVPDMALAVLALLPSAYLLMTTNAVYDRMEYLDALTLAQQVLGVLVILLVLEGVRRAVTPVMAGLVLLGLLYMAVCEHLPGLFNYRDIPFWHIVEAMVWVPIAGGVYGPLTGIAATLVAVFIVFGAAIEASGVGQFFHDLGTKVAGRQAGGPAKVEVISSALFGTISGSSTANVYATGSFTIPAMIRLGYRPAFAGGVEAAASVGGQIMPPVMGAGAFVMAEITNIPYPQIAIAAILGSLLYFLMILVSVHFEAKRRRLAGCDPSEIPPWRVVGRTAHLLLPVFALVALLALGFSPHFSAAVCVLATLAACYLRRATWLTPRQIFGLFAAAGRNMVIIALACAAAGMFVAALTNTGFVVALSQVIVGLSGGDVLVAGGLLMLCTLLLGMGVPTTAAYVIGASVGAPPLIQMGVEPLAAHMFVFYFAILADATPPVSVASYAAASIAKADPLRVGGVAFRLALAGFVVGFSYLQTPALLMQGPWTGVVGEFLAVGAGLALLAACLSGHFAADLPVPLRALVGAGALFCVVAHGLPDWQRLGAEAALALMLWLLPRRAAVARAA